MFSQLNGFKYSNETQFNSISVICLHTVKWLNSSIWPIDRTLTGTTTLGQSGPGSDSNEGILQIPQSSGTGNSPSDCLGLDTDRGGVLPRCSDAVGLFYFPSQMGWGGGRLVIVFNGISTSDRLFNVEIWSCKYFIIREKKKETEWREKIKKRNKREEVGKIERKAKREKG